ncbi:keratin, type I cytoskeletal 10-like [Phasianus colchicus]|uniref:keratin, type I cytoskeletal 10-like n=1 Tax=Phasianus colchicus TaxID=9054 RepID=UPI00129E99FC|nr:keratin, type I cytoskeletal 10-like [Phasianus colchicus]
MAAAVEEEESAEAAADGEADGAALREMEEMVAELYRFRDAARHGDDGGHDGDDGGHDSDGGHDGGGHDGGGHDGGGHDGGGHDDDDDDGDGGGEDGEHKDGDGRKGTAEAAAALEEEVERIVQRMEGIRGETWRPIETHRAP